MQWDYQCDWRFDWMNISCCTSMNYFAVQKFSIICSENNNITFNEILSYLYTVSHHLANKCVYMFNRKKTDSEEQPGSVRFLNKQNTTFFLTAKLNTL